jgi:cob(I)alamin adenosyltransferase
LLFGGRTPKDAPGPAAYGTTDEAIAAFGLARAECAPGDELFDLVVRLQRELFVVGAELATAPENRHKLTAGSTLVTPEMVEALEPIIDDLTGRFEQPTEFVLPGENRVAAALDLARTIVRRAERESVTAAREGWVPADSAVIPYLNRLADLCWTLARWQEGEYRPARGDR